MSSVTSPLASPALPRRQTALVVAGPGQLALHHDAPLPHLAPDMALVRTVAVAINPVDAKMLDYSPAVGAIHGYDFAGVVVGLGSEAPGHLSIGDRVAGAVHGNNSLEPCVGAFAQYVGATAELLLKIPDGMAFEEASTLGIGLATAGLVLFRELEIPVRIEDLIVRAADAKISPNAAPSGAWVLVSGGSTATGTRAIQMLKLAGLRPIATCSPSNFALVLEFGAEKAFDYRSPECAKEIRAYTRNGLAYAIDCVSESDSAQLCYGAIGRAGGRYCGVEPVRQAVAATRPTIRASWLMVLTMFGGRVALDGEYARDASAADRALSAKIFAVTQKLLDNGRIKSHPVRVLAGKWAGVIQGIDIIRTGPVSGQKLVVRVDGDA
ncbi:GroES-like protein [Glarea lozoyensis ATCC 20868]|uniref:GroES-like protein n=1 Tax=Glarea lozoyensis (strain ATCC 20868 / MF5171) TaxID=1116229 RepID=S3D7L6_GLAL2|nr:GroES-like protein [Glarea lozoyensis ATCC 20868]EPE33745.1 GroES-like protein [Glarea lozoyensis ATCC 20868]